MHRCSLQSLCIIPNEKEYDNLTNQQSFAALPREILLPNNGEVAGLYSKWMRRERAAQIQRMAALNLLQISRMVEGGAN